MDMLGIIPPIIGWPPGDIGWPPIMGLLPPGDIWPLIMPMLGPGYICPLIMWVGDIWPGESPPDMLCWGCWYIICWGCCMPIMPPCCCICCICCIICISCACCACWSMPCIGMPPICIGICCISFSPFSIMPPSSAAACPYWSSWPPFCSLAPMSWKLLRLSNLPVCTTASSSSLSANSSISKVCPATVFSTVLRTSPWIRMCSRILTWR
mmetsp:Transcript_12019/g.30765  ORF Transcript_12019/g.30765 Transcript_12019/m.30765 type:complete len:210 (+) Transcript_12019:58-687(+)